VTELLHKSRCKEYKKQCFLKGYVLEKKIRQKGQLLQVENTVPFLGLVYLYRKNNAIPSIKNKGEPMAQACNPSYSGGRDQEDHNSKPAPDK
jgi:hypothetical protein